MSGNILNLSREEFDYYGRHLLLEQVGLAGQKRLKNSSVLLVGLGGLGSPMALYLAGAGVGKIGIVEFDCVDISNLHRQVLYSTSQIGQPKLQCGVERLRGINPHIEIISHAEALSANNARRLVKDYDLVADGSDNFATRYLVNDACVLENKPLVAASVFRFEGQLSVFHYRGGPCYRCLYAEPPPPGAVPSCAEGGVLGVLPGIMGTLQACEVIKILLEKGEVLSEKLLLFDALGSGFTQFKFKRSKDCAVCGDHPTIKEVRAMEIRCETPAPSEIKTMNVTELATHLKAGLGTFLLVDVREDFERQAGAILPSRHIKLGDILQNNFELPRDQDLVMYCKSGGRSQRAAQHLYDQGYRRLFNLTGGITAWNAKHPAKS